MIEKSKLIEAVYKASLTKRATLVIFYLINRANKDLACFPGIKTIASDCNMSDRTVRRAMDDLLKGGFIKKEPRYRENGGQSSNLYILIYDAVSEVLIEEEEVFTSRSDEINNDKLNKMESIDFDDYNSSALKNSESFKINEHNINSRLDNKVIILNSTISDNHELKNQIFINGLENQIDLPS